MIFDTDIFIWAQRRNLKAVTLLEGAESRSLSVQTYLELLQCARNQREQNLTRDYLSTFSFVVLPLTENIGHRASVYIEEYSLKSGLRAGDALIAATAVERNLPLCTSNAKHFSIIQELDLRTFKPV